MVVWPFFIFGLSSTFITLAAVGSGAIAVIFILSAILGRPDVHVTDQGFVNRNLFGSRSIRWADIEGAFEVRRVGLLKSIVFRYTPEFKANCGKKRRAPCPGFDDAIVGCYQLSMEQLADLLNSQRRQFLPPNTDDQELDS